MGNLSGWTTKRVGQRLMSMGLLILKSILLIYLAIQDWRYRSIPVWGLITLAILIVLESLQLIRPIDLIITFTINSALMVFQFFLLQIYFSLREKKWVKLTHGYIGLGDILFFTCMAGTMSVIWFSWTFLGSLMFSLLTFSLLMALNIIGKRIPLVTGTAIFYLLFFWITWYQSINLYH